jgi:GNAT superfamily N-acetyltransferase
MTHAPSLTALFSLQPAAMHIRQVRADEVNLVADMLNAAAASLAERGNALWSAADVSGVAVAEHVKTGMYYVAFDDEGPVGVFRFQLEDRLFWPEVVDGSSAFIHKIAVYPHKQGKDVSHVLLRYACNLARQNGRQFLRLDCMSSRPKLQAVYERFGFKHHSVKKLGNRVFDRFELAVESADGELVAQSAQE